MVAMPGASSAGWGGSLAATTDYVFRGISQTQGEPALQGDLHYSAQAGWFAGLWASNIDPGSSYIGHVEIDAYAGFAWTPASDWNARVSYVRYLYPDASPRTGYDYGELVAGLGYRDRAYASIAWSPDEIRIPKSGYEHSGTALSYELSLRQPIWRGLALAAGVGYYDLSSLFEKSYRSWSGTVSYTIRAVEFDLSRFANDATARELFGRDAADDRWVLTAMWRF
ncbi:MAG: hypothetical protein FIB04_07465 [Gammaproteobacteria bacterium]|nr:hypothetical protein [Gammaproteobacteria bacterium]